MAPIIALTALAALGPIQGPVPRTVPRPEAARPAVLVSGIGRFSYAANPAAVAYFLAAMAWSTVW
jgi:hypothetical protein